MSRRKSHMGVLRNTHENAGGPLSEAMRKKRRQSTLTASYVARDDENIVAGQKETPQATPRRRALETPRRTPGSTQTSQSTTSSSMNVLPRNADFSSALAKTPSRNAFYVKVASARKRLSASSQAKNDTQPLLDLFDQMTDNNGTIAEVDSSFASSKSSSSGGSPSDFLNASVQSNPEHTSASVFCMLQGTKGMVNKGHGHGETNDQVESIVARPPQGDPQETNHQEDCKVAPVGPPLTLTLDSNNDNPNMLRLGGLARNSSVPVARRSFTRRDSLHGQSPSVGSIRDKVQSFTEALKQRRLSRQSIGSRLSMGSARSEKNDDKDTSMSQGLPTNVLLEVAQTTPKSPLEKNSPSVENDDDDDATASSFGDLFDGIDGASEIISGTETASDIDYTAGNLQHYRPSVSLRVSLLPEKLEGSKLSLSGEEEGLKHTSSSDQDDRKLPGLQEEEEQSVAHSANEAGMTVGENSAVTKEAVGFSSQSSRLGTPIESHHLADPSPRPIPESIAFEATDSSQKVGPSTASSPSPARGRKAPKSPMSLMDSPARNTRSKTPKSPMNSVDSPARNTRSKTPKSPMSLMDSPARNTRSSSKRLAASSEKKRSLDPSITIEDNQGSVAKKGRQSTGHHIVSSFRKSHPASEKKVVFRSPDFAEFNKHSPSTSLTPMPKSASKSVAPTPEITKTLEGGMAELLKNIDGEDEIEPNSAVDSSTSTAGSTPFAARRKDSIGTPAGLEKNFDQVLENVADDTDNGNHDISTTSLLVESQAGDETGVDERIYDPPSNMDEALKDAETWDNDDAASDMSDSETGEFTGDINNGDDGEQTQEIELDMDAMLQSVGANDDHLQLQLTDEVTTSVAHRTGRRSTFSRRLSLMTPSRLSTKESDEEEHSIEGQILTQDATAEIETKSPGLELRVNDVLEIAQESLSSLQKAEDILAEMCTSLETKPSRFLEKELCEFLENSSVHFEGEKPVIDSEFFSMLEDPKKRNVLGVQQGLRSERSGDIKNQLIHLWEETTKSKHQSLKSFLWGTVAQMEESFANSMASKIDSLESEKSQLDTQIQRTEDAEYQASSIAKENFAQLQKKRRATLQQRKVTSNRLEEELRKLEELSETAASTLEEAKSKQERVRLHRTALDNQEKLNNEKVLARETATDKSVQWKITTTVLPYEIVDLAKSRLTFAYTGPCPSASISVSFPTTNERFHRCIANIDSTVYPVAKPRNTEKYKSVMDLLKSRTNFICQQLSASDVSSTDDVRDLLRDAYNQLNRMESTFNEIGALIRRYDVSLSVGKAPSLQDPEFEFAVTFAGLDKKVVAVFEIKESYPRSPVNVRLIGIEGNIECDEIESNLARAAKHGDGQLLRACNIISASVL